MPEEFVEIDKHGTVRVYNIKENDKCYTPFMKMMKCLNEKKHKKHCMDTLEKWDICIIEKYPR